MGEIRDTATRAFASLPREPGTIRFFKRNQGGYCVYDCFGSDADAVASGSYGDVQVRSGLRESAL